MIDPWALENAEEDLSPECGDGLNVENFAREQEEAWVRPSCLGILSSFVLLLVHATK